MLKDKYPRPTRNVKYKFTERVNVWAIIIMTHQTIIEHDLRKRSTLYNVFRSVSLGKKVDTFVNLLLILFEFSTLHYELQL